MTILLWTVGGLTAWWLFGFCWSGCLPVMKQKMIMKNVPMIKPA
ncbi:Uncharacterised protein [Enterobacter cancerogenus]|uniref:Uncharacterized protein n=1 Tax=Enterobacter cancerogenus TaxID=69218 RepID=A0A484YLS7_9ENTR|nr:Uncharacterised protein [Enterobacter cancerogenus]